MLRNNGRHNFRSPYFPQPSLVLDFAGTGTLDPRVTFTRSTTGTYYNSSGVLSTAAINEPRFDFNPTTGESLGLLIEQSSTNLLFQSQTFNNLGVWAVANATLTANANIAPDGTQTVFQLIPSASSTFTNVGQSITATSQAYTTSWYVKYNGVQFVQILFGGGLSTNYANYDLINGTVTGGTYTSATITPIGNGMYRISTTNTFAATSSGIYLAAIATGTSARASNYTGNGYSGIYIWGAQLEALAFPTSYIPTTSAQVTRASDNASMTGTNFSSWYNNAQGTVYVETSRPTNVGQNTAYTISDGSTGNNIIWTTYNTSLYETIIKNSGTTSADMFASITYLANFPYKNAVTYASNSFAVVLNGAAPLTDSSGLVPVSCSALYLGSTWVNSVYLNGWIKKFAYYPQALTSAQLQALTGS